MKRTVQMAKGNVCSARQGRKKAADVRSPWNRTGPVIELHPYRGMDFHAIEMQKAFEERERNRQLTGRQHVIKPVEPPLVKFMRFIVSNVKIPQTKKAGAKDGQANSEAAGGVQNV